MRCDSGRASVRGAQTPRNSSAASRRRLQRRGSRSLARRAAGGDDTYEVLSVTGTDGTADAATLVVNAGASSQPLWSIGRTRGATTVNPAARRTGSSTGTRSSRADHVLPRPGRRGGLAEAQAEAGGDAGEAVEMSGWNRPGFRALVLKLESRNASELARLRCLRDAHGRIARSRQRAKLALRAREAR